MNKDQLLTLTEGKTENEIKQILADNYGIHWDFYDRQCKLWFAKVFTYCHPSHLEEELNFFLWLVNFFAPLFGFSFQEEDTVFLGCICPGGQKQTILYYSLTRTR